MCFHSWIPLPSLGREEITLSLFSTWCSGRHQFLLLFFPEGPCQQPCSSSTPGDDWVSSSCLSLLPAAPHPSLHPITLWLVTCFLTTSWLRLHQRSVTCLPLPSLTAVVTHLGSLSKIYPVGWGLLSPVPLWVPRVLP